MLVCSLHKYPAMVLMVHKQLHTLDLRVHDHNNYNAQEVWLVHLTWSKCNLDGIRVKKLCAVEERPVVHAKNIAVLQR